MPRTTSSVCTKSRGASSGRTTSSPPKSASSASSGNRAGPPPGPTAEKTRRLTNGSAGGEEGFLFGGLRDEIRIVAGLRRLVLSRAPLRLVARPVEPPVRKVDEDSDPRAADALEERPQPGAVRRKERRVHDGRGPVLGQHASRGTRDRPRRRARRRRAGGGRTRRRVLPSAARPSPASSNVSRRTTPSPVPSSLRTTADPRKPAPPATRTRLTGWAGASPRGSSARRRTASGCRISAGRG